MRKEDIHLSEIVRILLGEAPAEFMVEVLIRSLFVFAVLLFVVKLLGKRMAGQITMTEMAVMLTLGAILAPALQMPDRGVLLVVVALLCAVFFQRGLTWLNFKYSTTERITQGKCILLVEDGIIHMAGLKEAHMTHEQLFSKLRENGIISLGELEAVYMEIGGLYSIFKASEERPGLIVMPPDDNEILDKVAVANQDKKSCCNCGYTVSANAAALCDNCGGNEWVEARKII